MEHHLLVEAADHDHRLLIGAACVEAAPQQAAGQLTGVSKRLEQQGPVPGEPYCELPDGDDSRPMPQLQASTELLNTIFL